MIKLLQMKMEPILIGYNNVNGDAGFFAEFENIYYIHKGIKLYSTSENIRNKFVETDYYLLENNKVCKFKRTYSERKYIYSKKPETVVKQLIRENKCTQLVKILNSLILESTTSKVNKPKIAKKTA